MDIVDKFLRGHHESLLKHLDTVTTGNFKGPVILEFVDQVLDQWADVMTGRQIKAADRVERTFWYTLYQIEEIAELPLHGISDPYRTKQLQDLACLGQLLRKGGELPQQFFATRPDGEPESFDIEELDLMD